MPNRVKKIAIIGPGLLGGSLALAVRAKHPECQIALWARRDAAVAEVEAAGIADLASTALAPVVEGADLVVFCVPMEVMPALAAQMVPYLKTDAMVTDVGSAKLEVVEQLGAIFAQKGRFVGSHPMAGSEQSGLAAARRDLFEGAVCIVTPVETSDRQAVEAIGAFWEELGCRVRCLNPAEHDQAIGLVSHLPHLLAAVLVDFVCSRNPNSVNFCGNGFRDTTRIASGPAGMWAGIFASNRSVLSTELDLFIAKLQQVATILKQGDDEAMTRLLADAKRERDRIPPARRQNP